MSSFIINILKLLIINILKFLITEVLKFLTIIIKVIQINKVVNKVKEEFNLSELFLIIITQLVCLFFALFLFRSQLYNYVINKDNI